MFGTLILGITGWEIGSTVVAAAKAAPVPTFLVGGGAAWLFWRFWWTSERGTQQRSDARSLVSEAAAGIAGVWARADEARLLLEAAAFVPDDEPTIDAKVARIVAIAPFPPRAADVGRRLGVSTQKAASILRAPTFARSMDGEYVLGRRHVEQPAAAEIIQFDGP